MPPPVSASASGGSASGTHERSPKRAGLAGPPKKQGAAEDAFQVYFGDLPSPRMIEVVRPKELEVPKWRVVPECEAASGKSSGGGKGGNGKKPVPTNGDKAHADKSHSAAAGSAGLNGADGGDESELSDADDTSDATFELRHNRTLDQAIHAARAVARKLVAQKQRQQQQGQQQGQQADGAGGLAEGEEW
eukprot:5298162-Prymnesium_polylepis.1